MALQHRNQDSQDATQRGVGAGSRAPGASRRGETARTIGDFPPRPGRPSGAPAETRNGPQRRRAARIAVGLPVQLRRRREAQPTVSLCYDLAPGGMFIETSQPLRPGNVLRFECGYGPDCGFAGLARVTWVRAESSAGGPQGVGVSFIGLDPRGEAVIRAILAEHGLTQLEPERDASLLPPAATGREPTGRTLTDRMPDRGHATTTEGSGVQALPTVPVGADKRRSPRAALSLDMRYASEALRVERDGICENLSASGMFLAADEPLAVGTSVRLHCAVGVAAHAIEGTGRVLWRRTRAARDGRPAGMAIEFTQLSPESFDVIEAVLHTVGGGASPRASVPAAPPRTEASRTALVPPPAAGAPAVAPVVAVTDPHIRPQRTISVDSLPAVVHAHDEAYVDSPADAYYEAVADGTVPAVDPSDAAAEGGQDMAPEGTAHRSRSMLREERLRELIAAHVEPEFTAPPKPAVSTPGPVGGPLRPKQTRPAVNMSGAFAGVGLGPRLAFGGAVLIVAWLIGRAISLLL